MRAWAHKGSWFHTVSITTLLFCILQIKNCLFIIFIFFIFGRIRENKSFQLCTEQELQQCLCELIVHHIMGVVFRYVWIQSSFLKILSLITCISGHIQKSCRASDVATGRAFGAHSLDGEKQAMVSPFPRMLLKPAKWRCCTSTGGARGVLVWLGWAW